MTPRKRNQIATAVAGVAVVLIIVALVGIPLGWYSGSSVAVEPPTHIDPPPPPKMVLSAEQVAADAALAPPIACTADSAKHVEVILANPPINAGIGVDGVRSGFDASIAYVNARAAPWTATLRSLCNPDGTLRVKVETVGQLDTFEDVVSAVRAKGYTQTDVKYLVVYNGRTSQFYAGVANISGFTGGTAYAVTFGYTQPHVMLHELTHTLGAVGTRAIHSTGAGHCTDGPDIMCYPDGGPNPYSATGCKASTTEVWDCGADDYANPNGPIRDAAGNPLPAYYNLLDCTDAYIAFSKCSGGSTTTTTTTPPPPTSTTTTIPPTTTAPPPPTALPAPTGFSVRTLSTTSIQIAWQPIGGATAYVVQRKPSSDGSWTYLGRTPYPRWNANTLCGSWAYRSAGVDAAGKQGAYGQITVNRSC